MAQEHRQSRARPCIDGHDGGRDAEVNQKTQQRGGDAAVEGRAAEQAAGDPLQQPHRGNCYSIMTRGGERFRVVNLDRQERSYLVADIEALPDEPSPAPAMAMVGQRVASLFDEYYRKLVALSGGWQRC